MTLKEKIKNGKKTIGSHIMLADIAIGTIAGRVGFDFVWVDVEHTYMSFEQVLAHIVSVKAVGTPVIVRVPQDDLTFTKKILEMGPDGIIFPMVSSAEEANKLISYTLYPPYGKRGFGPMNANGYGHTDAWEYVENSKDDICRFIQIESKTAVEELEKIMKNPFIDGYIFGPNDLSGSINEIGNVFGENNLRLMHNAIEKLRKQGKYIGLSTGDISVDTLTRWHDMGIDMLSAGADFGYLVDAYKTAYQNLKKTHLETE